MKLKKKEIILHSLQALQNVLAKEKALTNITIQDLDLRKTHLGWEGVKIENATFLGCQLDLEDELTLRRKGAHVYIKYNDTPYHPYRRDLYTWEELMEGYTPEQDNSTDLKIYKHFSEHRFRTDIHEALNQRIHDHAIDHSLRELVQYDDNGMTEKKCVGIMGGHSTSRHDEFYYATARTAQLLTQAGYFVVSGGGPGIMEAANLGAWMGNYSEAELLHAVKLLQANIIPKSAQASSKKVPEYAQKEYFGNSKAVLETYPDGCESLAIPTWFYGHEPSNFFATRIAKYFSNSIREDTLLAISLHGVIFAPGSAGTTQEIFMEATQNHYGTFNCYSPMVFLGHKRYEIDSLIFPLLKQLAWGREYYKLLHLTDSPEAVIQWLKTHPPRMVK